MQTKAQSQNGVVNLPPRMKAALEQYQKRVWTIKLAEGALAANLWYPCLIYHRFLLGPGVRYTDASTGAHLSGWYGRNGFSLTHEVLQLGLEASAIGWCRSAVEAKVSTFWGSRARHCRISA